jgi:hypothetical protein
MALERSASLASLLAHLALKYQANSSNLLKQVAGVDWWVEMGLIGLR